MKIPTFHFHSIVNVKTMHELLSHILFWKIAVLFVFNGKILQHRHHQMG